MQNVIMLNVANKPFMLSGIMLNVVMLSVVVLNVVVPLERIDKDKHSSLLRTFVNYGRKKFYKIAAWPGFRILFLLSLIKSKLS
jgi:hypothetical protein